MAQQVIVQLVDDMDGSASDDIATVPFELDGVSYEIDLTPDNAARLRNQLDDYIKSARRVGHVKGGTRGTRKLSTTKPDREQNQAIRAWAQQNGYELSDRGRIPANVTDAFEAAHTDKKRT